MFALLSIPFSEDLNVSLKTYAHQRLKGRCYLLIENIMYIGGHLQTSTPKMFGGAPHTCLASLLVELPVVKLVFTPLFSKELSEIGTPSSRASNVIIDLVTRITGSINQAC
ncbi:hypothetical protein V6N12_009969 [Hibiscus sabdariffa]|uniref:Uncharacterized protein n=1 Tax=Hibiscus sabdariffa TaxID=183260 RepID=A0ABR2ECQ5_9ROSI